MFKNVASQKVRLFAFTAATGLPKTGDAANLTAYLSKDYGAVTVLGDTSATEEDATNAAGWYLFDVTQTESNCDVANFTGKSSTSGVVVVGRELWPRPPNFTKFALDTNGRTDVGNFGGTAGTFSGGRPEVNVTHAAGTAWNSGAIGAATLATDTITAAKVAADVTTEITSGLATASALATVAGYVDTEVAAIKTVTDKLGSMLQLDNGSPLRWQFTMDAVGKVFEGMFTYTTPYTIGDATYTTVVGELGQLLNGNNVAINAIKTTTDSVATMLEFDGVSAFRWTMPAMLNTWMVPLNDVDFPGGTSGQRLFWIDYGPTSWLGTMIEEHPVWAGTYRFTKDAVDQILADMIDTNASPYGRQFNSYALMNAPTGGGGGGGDPWLTALPGAYSAGTAGYIVGHNLDAQVSTRLATSGYTAPLNAAGVRGAVGLASANLDTQLDALPTNGELATALAAADDATLAAIAGLPAPLTAAGTRAALGLASANLDTQLDALPTNAELATALAAADDATLAAIATMPDANAIADAVLKRDWTAIAGDPAQRSVWNALRFIRNGFTISGSTLTVLKEDDSSAAYTRDLASDPAADPIVGVS